MSSNCYFLSVEPFRPLVQKLVGPLSCRGMNEFFYVIDRLGLVGRKVSHFLSIHNQKNRKDSSRSYKCIIINAAKAQFCRENYVKYS
jgi:hypothetical protein